jgi:hypothetical protein
MMNYLLSFLLIANNIFLITQVINILSYNFNTKDLMVILPNIVYPMEKTILTVSVFCTVALAHQAYLLTWKYEEYKIISSSSESLRKQTNAYALPITVLAAVINLPRWFSYGIESNENGYKKIEKSLKRNFYYAIYYENFVLNVLTVFVPITLLVFFNWSVYNFVKKKQQDIDSVLSKGYSIKHKNEKNDQKKIEESNHQPQANILIVIIVLFISCHFPRCMLKFSDGYPKQIEHLILDTIGRVLLIAYASATPFIYLAKNTRFRNQFFVLFNKLCLRRRVSSYEVDAFANKSTMKMKETKTISETS